VDQYEKIKLWEKALGGQLYLMILPAQIFSRLYQEKVKASTAIRPIFAAKCLKSVVGLHTSAIPQLP
jgi:hypothetical protein